MAEGNEDPGGADAPASIWLVCPAIMDPRNGGIAKDAFLDVVRLSNGNAQNTGLLNNFSCLQNTGKFCNEAAPGN
jgi:3-deoxy-D-arabino-heptulosonate 7-phosphate (DAHP) synthase